MLGSRGRLRDRPPISRTDGREIDSPLPNAPALEHRYLGLYFISTIGDLKVLVYKTNLHFHTDGKLLPNGSYTVPIKDMLAQMIDEARPKLFLTTGTSGGVYCSMQLGDVAVTRAAHFLCEQHYKSAPFNGKTYTSKWERSRWTTPCSAWCAAS